MKYLIAGLGNIGPTYDLTRHNVGFEIVDKLASEFEASFVIEKLALKTLIKHKGRQLILIKPTTYMNLSGKAIKYWLKKENIPIENLLVVLDDIALPFGTVRLKGKGSDGGHNGLKDIHQELETTSYNRLRFGVGSDFHGGQQIKYVLGKWNNDELAELPTKIEHATEAIKSFCTNGMANTMNNFNNK